MTGYLDKLCTDSCTLNSVLYVFVKKKNHLSTKRFSFYVVEILLY